MFHIGFVQVLVL